MFLRFISKTARNTIRRFSTEAKKSDELNFKEDMLPYMVLYGSFGGALGVYRSYKYNLPLKYEAKWMLYGIGLGTLGLFGSIPTTITFTINFLEKPTSKYYYDKSIFLSENTTDEEITRIVNEFKELDADIYQNNNYIHVEYRVYFDDDFENLIQIKEKMNSLKNE